MTEAPNEEAKMAAQQLRRELFAMIEAAIDNRWANVEDGAESVIELARHLQNIEKSYER